MQEVYKKRISQLFDGFEGVEADIDDINALNCCEQITLCPF